MAQATTELTAVPFLPRKVSLATLREAAAVCRGCPLYENATQTVFGSGKKSSRLFLVGEQPGDEEDRRGLPFVGPAGRLLDEALEAAGLDRSEAYVTNVVKHFKWEAKGKRRLHQKPNAREIGACLPWLEKEIEVTRPEVLVLLGATAAQALLGKAFRVSRDRGVVMESSLAPHAVATVHPSSILRQRTSEDREREMARFTDDLRIVAGLLNGSHGSRPRRGSA